MDEKCAVCLLDIMLLYRAGVHSILDKLLYDVHSVNIAF